MALATAGGGLDGEFDDEEEICRICRCGQEDGRPLFHPCICTGSIKFVHEDCLLEWLTHRSAANNGARSKCELCGHRFGFTPVYEPGAPSSLSMFEFAMLSGVRALKLVPFALRLVLVILTWGVFIPIATCVMFRILSLGKLDRSGELQLAYENAQSGWVCFMLRLRMALEGGYYASWGIGVCASVSIFLSFLTLISVVDFVREHDMLVDNPEEDDFYEEDEDEEDVEDEEDEGRAQEAPGPDGDNAGRLGANAAALGAIEEIDEDDGMPGGGLGYGLGGLGLEAVLPFGDAAAAGDIAALQAGDGEPRAEDNAQPGAGAANVDLDEHQDLVQNAQQEQEEAGFADGMDDVDDDDENNVGDLNVAMDELLGLRGPGWMLFHNVLWLLTFHGLYLCVALFAPTTVGAVVMSVLSRVSEWATGTQLLGPEDEAFLLRTLHKLRSEQLEEQSNMRRFNESVQGPWAAVMAPNAAPAETTEPLCAASDELKEGREAFFAELHWVLLEIGAVLVGYMTVAWALASLFCFARMVRDGAAHRASRRNWNRLARVLRLMSRTFKVIIIVFLKMGIFPVLLGLLLEVAGRDLVDLGPMSRFTFAAEHPIFAVMILWVAGITHMLVITVIVLELRDVLHPDILHGILRPKDAEESLLRTVLEEPISRHVRRMVLASAIYTFLVLAFIYVPTQLVLRSGFHDLLPYRPALHYTVLEVQLPTELFFIHIGVLNLLDHGKDLIRGGIESWFRCVCGALGLTRFLLPTPGHGGAREEEAKEDDETVALADRRSANAEAAEDEGEIVLEQDPASDAALLGLAPRRQPRHWVFRVLCLLALAWATSLAATMCALVTPLYVGKATVSLLQVPCTHEPFIYGIGSLVTWRLCAAAMALRLHRAPSALVAMLRHGAASPSLNAARALIEWALLAALTLVLVPWAFGALIQINVLVPAQHPRLVPPTEAATDRWFGWQFPTQLGALASALAGTTEQVAATELQRARHLSAEQSESLARALVLSCSPLHDWMMGLVLGFVLLQVLLLPDVMQQREALMGLHQRLVAASQDLVRNHDCVTMLYGFALPVFGVEMAALLVPIVGPAAPDAVLYAVSGMSLYSAYGLVQTARLGGAALAVLLLAPYFCLEAQRTWRLVHDALRDERYLIGKRLHNMEQRQKRYSQKRSNVM